MNDNCNCLNGYFYGPAVAAYKTNGVSLIVEVVSAKKHAAVVIVAFAFAAPLAFVGPLFQNDFDIVMNCPLQISPRKIYYYRQILSRLLIAMVRNCHLLAERSDASNLICRYL